MRNAYDTLIIGAKHNDFGCAVHILPYGRAEKRSVRSDCFPAHETETKSPRVLKTSNVVLCRLGLVIASAQSRIAVEGPGLL
jgi:hypothetical protein